MKQKKIEPRYIADYGKGKYHVYDRMGDKNDVMIPDLSKDKFLNLSWMIDRGIGSIIGESAHFARVSELSAAQPLDEDEIRSLMKLCASKEIEFRFSPEKSIWKYRKKYFPDEPKSDELDLRTWDKAITDKPSIWDVALTFDNVEFHDPNDPIVVNSKYTAGNTYKAQLKQVSRIVSASKTPYKDTVPGQVVVETGCLDAVAERLENHSSECGKIKKGIASTTINKVPVKINLLEVLGFKRPKNNVGWLQSALNSCQLTTCMMLLIDQNGERYLNPLTNKPVGFKMMKQFGMVSSGFHMKPGFVRPKFYWHGTKSVSKKLFKDVFGIDGYSFGKMDFTDQDQEDLKVFIMTTCRIAYEQTVKAMKQYLDTPKHNLEKFVA